MKFNGTIHTERAIIDRLSPRAAYVFGTLSAVDLAIVQESFIRGTIARTFGASHVRGVIDELIDAGLLEYETIPDKPPRELLERERPAVVDPDPELLRWKVMGIFPGGDVYAGVVRAATKAEAEDQVRSSNLVPRGINFRVFLHRPPSGGAA